MGVIFNKDRDRLPPLLTHARIHICEGASARDIRHSGAGQNPAFLIIGGDAGAGRRARLNKLITVVHKLNSSVYTVQLMNAQDKEEALTLEILETIEKDSAVTQRHLATNLGVALGLANSYLRRCARKGLIKVHQAPANRYLYYVTPKGFAEKSRLTAKYLSSSFEFYRRAGDACRTAFKRCSEHGWSRVVLCGYSELAEIALLRAQETDVQIIGIYDPKQKVASRFGLPVWTSFDQVPAHDALLLTTLKKPDEFLQSLKQSVHNHESILIPSVLGLKKEALD